MKVRFALLIPFALLGLALSPGSVAWAESAGGVSWTAPAGWKAQRHSPMRAATYTVPAAGGDSEDGECGVYYFGTGGAGGVQANVKRWIGQFRAPDGGPADQLAQRASENINGIAVTTLDLTGTYLFKPFPMAPRATPKTGYRMLAAIVSAPEGEVFFKLTAPEKTTAAAEPNFRRMLQSLRK